MKGKVLSYDMYESTIFKKIKRTMDVIQEEKEQGFKRMWSQVGETDMTNVNNKSTNDNSKLNLLSVYDTR